MKYTKMKVDAGASYIVTQMFFDNDYYFKYVELCRKNGITVPIIPGIKPLTRKSTDDKDKIKQIGIEWCIAQSKELKAAGVPVLHYYMMSDASTVKKILKEVL